MTTRRLEGELEGIFWQATGPLRRAIRAARRELALARRRARGEAAPIFDPPRAGAPPVGPADWLEIGGAAAERGAAPLRLIGDLERLDWVARSGGPLLLRRPESSGAPVDAACSLGRIVTAPGEAPAPGSGGFAPARTAGAHRLLGPASAGRRRAPRLAAPGIERRPSDPPTAVLVLPFLAVGGAERLLLAYARALSGRRRLVVVTTEPHRRELGQTWSALAPLAELYPLGDWLERALHAEALRAIVERHAAEALVSWNGTLLFFEQAPALRRSFPRLRIVHQTYDHRVGWIRRLTPALRRAIDVQIAVNRPIAEELAGGRGVPEAQIALVRHGVAAAEPATLEAREATRRELGIPAGAVVLASFLRLHPQKRPLDLVEVARRTAADGAWLLLVGGGPLDAALRADLAARPAPNVVWRPLDPEPERFFAAADLCLMASEYEGLPIFLLEGMARGLPAVATAAGEIPELLAGGAGRVAAPGDVAALAAAVRELLDPAARRAAGAVARRVASERFSLERFVAETDAAIFGGAGS